MEPAKAIGKTENDTTAAMGRPHDDEVRTYRNPDGSIVQLMRQGDTIITIEVAARVPRFSA